MIENPTILLVNSDESLLTVLSYNLERYGFIVNSAKSGSIALASALQIQPNMIVIDDAIDKLDDNKVSSIELCTILRSKPNARDLPVIILTDDGSKYQHLKNSPNGLNDYIVKPFVPSELVSKIKNIFQKVRPVVASRFLEFKDIKMNVGAYKVTRNGRNIHLGPTEFKILQCLMELPSKVLSREHIMKHVWGYNSQVEPRTIDVHINRLRSALKNDNEREDMPLIKTIRSAGYCLSSRE